MSLIQLLGSVECHVWVDAVLVIILRWVKTLPGSLELVYQPHCDILVKNKCFQRMHKQIHCT